MWGPLTAGLTVPHDLDFSDRVKALNQLDVRPAENNRLVTLLQDVSARLWLLLARRVKALVDGPEGEPGLRLRLGGLKDVLGRPGSSSQLLERLVRTALHTLTAPPGTLVPDRPRVSGGRRPRPLHHRGRGRARYRTPPSPPTAAPPAPADPGTRDRASPLPCVAAPT